MKKMLKTGKKALSVFMTIMMLMTAWVWVAPTEASAAAGSYYVKISWECTNVGDDYAIAYPGYANRGNGNCVGISLYYKTNNGTGTENEKYWDLKSDMGTATSYTETATISGFPTRIFVYNDHGGITDKAVLKVTKIEIGSSSNSTLTTLWGGTISLDSTSNIKWAELKSDYSSSTDGSGDASVSTSTKGWTYPYADATTITWSDTPEDMTCPKSASNSAATQTVSASAKDQYGVQMFDPTWSVKGSNKSDGITVSPATSSASTTISITSAANIAGTTNSQTGTVTATWTGTNAAGTSIAKTSSKTFTIDDATYTATFKNHRNADGVLQSDYTTTAKYGVTPTAPTASDYSSGDYDYKFTGWNPTVSGITADTTYTATYSNGTFVGADYTEVDKAIVAADAIKANYGTEYELKYTLASRVALDTAINTVVTGLGRTQQSVVDGYAAEINAKIAALEPNKFDVIFLDKDGAILLYEKDVEYKESVTAPAYNEKYYDATNHYTFTGWDTDEYTSVVDDLVIQPVFTAEGHTYTTETVTSNCVTKGATKYTCSCGYSYIDGESDYGDHVWATEFTTDLEPTCTVAGSKSVHCTLCDAQKDITVIAPLGHLWSSQSVAVEATCGKIGIMAKVCDDCGICEHTIIDALEHDFEEKVVAPTCTTKGYTEYTCKRDNCGYSYRDNYTDVVAHSYGAWKTVSDAYCGVEGVKKQTCTECGYVNIGSIDALEHNLSGWTDVVAQTCTGKGYQVKTCSLCSNVIKEQWLDALGHNYVEKTVVAPTCESKGYTVEECDRADCGAQRIVAEKPALNHAWTSTNHAADCTHSAYIEHVCANDASHNYVEYVNGSIALTHDFTGTETIINAATCEADGEKTVKCSRCDVTTTVIIPKLGHSYGAWEVVKEATNTEDGQWKRVCGNNAEHIEYLTIPKGGHTWDNGTVTKTATCEETGTMVYKCTAHTDCGVTLEATIPVAQHTVAQKVTDATCTTPGSVKAYCSVCDANCEKPFSTIETPIKAHSFVAQDAVAPTCTTAGYTPYKCSDCDFTYNVFDGAEATGHVSWTETGRTNATCTTDGSVSYKCDKCAATKTEVLPKTGHNFVEDTSAATEATCTALATKTYECSCGASYVEHYGTLAEHNFVTLVKNVPATNDSLGYEERECVCGFTEITIIEATGTHVFGEKIAEECVAPTCTENGTDVYKCTAHTDCGAKSSVLVPRLGHTATAVYIAPTCIAEGSSKAVCSTCDTTLATTVIPAIGYHDFSGNGVKVDATCTADGTMTYTCETDGCTATKVETIPAKGHDLSTTVNDATCDKTGSVVTKCKNCSYTETTELAAKNHAWNNGEETKAPTCEGTGTMTYTCTLCGTTKTAEIPAKGHIWGDWTVTPSTNTATGSVSRECTICHKPESVEIPAGGHELVVDTKNSTDATCTTEGKTVYICENHADCGITVEVTLPVKQHTIVKENKEATCKEAGYSKTYCSACNKEFNFVVIPVKAHEYVAQTAVAPTCTTSGYTPYACTCSSNYVLITAPAKGHSYTEKVSSTADCTNSGKMTLKCACGATMETEVPALGHNYMLKSGTAATCAAAATETYECSREGCDASYTISVDNKTENHTWNDWEVVEAATYTSLGYKIRTCKVCGKLEVETIRATGDHVFDILVSETLPNCETSGEQIYSCSTNHNCGLTSIVTVPATGHDEIVTTVAATCDKDGSITTTCKNCDYEKLEAIPALGHTYGEGVVTPATCKTAGNIRYTCTCGAIKDVEISVDTSAHSLDVTVEQATCTADGKVTVTCKNGCDYKDETVIPAKGHTFTGAESIVKNATCTADGEKTVQCANCTETKTEAIAKLGHNMKAGAAVAPTCTSSGYTPYSCENKCGHSYKVYDENQPAKGHTWSDWTIVTDATQDTEGLKRRSCTACNDATEEQKIPAMKHEMKVIENVASTCKTAGHITYECSVAHEGVACGYTLVVDLPVIAHTLSTTVNEATCTATGSVVTSCDCGYSETVILDIVAHKEALSIIPADCENVGYAVTNCAVCNKEIQRQEISALGHSFDDSIEANVKITATATCAKEGSKEVKCSRCDDVRTVVIPKLSHEFEVIETHTATCTESGYVVKDCKNCDETYNEFVSDPTGHKWNSGVETTPATCTANGVKTYTCANDAKHTYTETIAKLGHDWGDWEVTLNPTGTVDGIQSRKCKICGATENATIPALGGTTTYKVTFVVDGKTVATQTVNHNGKATAPIISNKAPDASNHYSYVWDVDFSRVTSDLTVTAIFTPAAHTYGAWITDITPDCNNEGRRYRLCIADGCGYAQYETLEKTEHSFIVLDGGMQPTCTDNGFEKVECEFCHKTEDRTLKRLGHVFTYHEAVDPTCDTDGVAGHYSCSRCGKNYKDRAGKTEITDIVVSKTYHTFIVVEGSEATCTKDGKTDYMYCTTCGYTRNPESIPATGHADGNNDNTCDKCGSTYMENNTIVCSCSCHKNGFFNELIYKILSFFWRLFGSNKSCECGKVHY